MGGVPRSLPVCRPSAQRARRRKIDPEHRSGDGSNHAELPRRSDRFTAATRLPVGMLDHGRWANGDRESDSLDAGSLLVGPQQSCGGPTEPGNGRSRIVSWVRSATQSAASVNLRIRAIVSDGSNDRRIDVFRTPFPAPVHGRVANRGARVEALAAAKSQQRPAAARRKAAPTPRSNAPRRTGGRLGSATSRFRGTAWAPPC